MVKIKEFIDKDGNNSFAKWFDGLNTEAAGKIAIVLVRLETGNFSNVESVGAGIHEYKIHYGPGYRVYFGQDGNELIILLGGGTKKQQNSDIEKAKELWKQYKKEKKENKKKEKNPPARKKGDKNANKRL